MAIFTVPALVVMLGIAARFLVKYIVTKTLLLLGLGFVSYLGVSTLVDEFETLILANYGSLESSMWQMASLCGLDVSITIVISALALSMQIKIVVAGAKMLTSIGR